MHTWTQHRLGRVGPVRRMATDRADSDRARGDGGGGGVKGD